MNIAVYLGSTLGKDPSFKEDTFQLGRWIGKEKHTLVYGGGNNGLMAEVANGCLAENGKVIGVIPEFLKERELAHEGLDQLHIVQTMAERKTMMIEYAEAFVAMPGGVGTLEEISEIMSMIRLDQTHAPCIFYNTHHFYDDLKEFLERMHSEEFVDDEFMARVHFCASLDEVKEILSQYASEVNHG